MQWHTKNIKALLKAFKTSPKDGLTTRQAIEFAKEYGRNVIQSKQKFSVLNTLRAQVANPLVGVLFLIFLALLGMGKVVDAVAVLVVVVFNFLLSLYQEYKSFKVLDSLSKAYQQYITVIRNGRKQLINTQDIVPGDIIYLQSGDKAPADIRLIESNNLLISQAHITGEFEAVKKDAKATPPQDAPVSEHTNMVYSGSSILEGEAIGLAVATGKHTYTGKLARLTSENSAKESKFFLQVRELVLRLFYISFVFVLAVFVIGLYQGMDLQELGFVAVSLTVASIPEGILALVSIALAVAAQSVFKKGALAKTPESISILGRASIIMTDKTGTLTKGKMELKQIITFGQVSEKTLSPDAFFALKLATLASDAYIDKSSGENKSVGRPIEAAIVSRALKHSIEQEILEQNGYTRLDFAKFTPSKRYAVSLNKSEFGNILIYTGAPEALLEKSKYYYLKGSKHTLKNAQKEFFLSQLEKLAKIGAKVTAIAYQESQLDRINSQEEALNEAVFVGLLVFEDPLREDAKHYIQQARKMKIKVLMVTGDHKDTAATIAYKSRLLPSLHERIITGEEFSRMSDEEILQSIKRVSVFARMLPQQKLRLLNLLKHAKETVVMVGDGVNDAPALAAADVGVAVSSATEVAKQAADLILLKGGFSSLVEAVKQGRRVISNIKKITANLVIGTYTISFTVFASVLTRLPVAFTPVQVLWFNMINESLTVFPIAFEKKEANIYKKPSANNLKKILDRSLIKFILSVSLAVGMFLFGIYWIMLGQGVSFYDARAVIFVAASFAAVAFLISTAKFSKTVLSKNYFNNKMLPRGIFMAFASLLIVIYVDFFAQLLNLEGFRLVYLVFAFLSFVFALFVSEVAKVLFLLKKD